MFSPSYIAKMSADATKKAARAHRAPHPLWDESTAWADFRSAPFLGDHCPTSWEPIGEDTADLPATLVNRSWSAGTGNLTFFADSSGFGSDTELALSIRQQQEVAEALVQAARARKETWGVGILEVGQFQVVVGVFRRKRARKAA